MYFNSFSAEEAGDKVCKENTDDVSMGTFEYRSIWKQTIRNKKLIVT